MVINCHESDTAAGGIIFNVFSYDVVSIRDSNSLPPQHQANALRVKPRLRVYAHHNEELRMK